MPKGSLREHTCLPGETIRSITQPLLSDCLQERRCTSRKKELDASCPMLQSWQLVLCGGQRVACSILCYKYFITYSSNCFTPISWWKPFGINGLTEMAYLILEIVLFEIFHFLWNRLTPSFSYQVFIEFWFTAKLLLLALSGNLKCTGLAYGWYKVSWGKMQKISLLPAQGAEVAVEARNCHTDSENRAIGRGEHPWAMERGGWLKIIY